MTPRRPERGVATVYFVLLAGTVIFGFMVMAIDFGRLYLVQGELQTAADAAALAAATQLVGTTNATLYAGDIQTGQIGASFDNTDANDNRFNLRLNQIGAGATDLATQVLVDFFSSRIDAIGNVNGGQSGPDARYARVTISAETPVLFPQFINPTFTPRPTVLAAAVAGISSPICSACNIDDLAVVALDTSDEVNWGFVQGDFYTFYMTASQQTPNITGCLATTPTTTPPLAIFDNTDAGVEYVALNHVPSGPAADTIDATLYELGVAPITQNPDPSFNLPGTVTIGTTEMPAGVQDPTTCTGAITAGLDLLCGLDARFGEVDPTTDNCAAIPSVDVLASLFPPDTEVAAGQDFEDYSTVYDGNLRRVITVPVLDSSPDDNPTPTVLGFRQFLVENTPGNPGIDTTTTAVTGAGAFVAQYIGYPVPLRCGGVGGSCTVSFGVGRTVLH